MSCATSAESGQVLSREGKLLDALDEFRRCARRSCPAVIASDCLRFVNDTQARVPSLVFRAQDDQGRDLTEVTVRLDGKVTTERLDGRAVEMNPGRHDITFEVGGHAPLSRQLVVVEGEKARVVSVLFGTEPAARPVEPTSPGPPVATWVLGGVGAASLVGFAYFGLTAKNERDDLVSTCGVTRTCSDTQVDGFRGKALAADVFLGVSVASLAAAGLVWALSNDEPDDSQPETVSIVVEPSGGVVRWNHAF